MNEIFTIGHGARPLDEFVKLLTHAHIEVLVDVRRYPGSRRHPHFAREELVQSLPSHAISYAWWGDTLGGRRMYDETHNRHVAWRNTSFRAYASHMETLEFRDAVDSLEERASRSRLAIMCAETLWWRCHRRLIADALVVDGFDVIHLGLGKDEPHVLTAAARVEADGTLVYDVIPEEE